jgi:NADH dehydrogenase FAD-containing subunit
MAESSSSSYKNLVVIGLSLAGACFIKALRKSGIPDGYRIVGIDSTHFAYFPVASLRAAVVPGWEDKIFQPFDNLLPKSGDHLLLTGATVVEVGAKSVKLASVHEAIGSDEVPYDKLVIATVCSFVLLFPAVKRV